MKKQVIALTLGSLMAAPLVMADVTVYGKAHLSMDQLNNGGAGAANVDSSYLSSNSSRFGLKGSEELGGDVKLFWQFENTFDMGAGTTYLSQRDTYMALAKGGSTLLLGRANTPMKNLRASVDLFGDTIADSRNITRKHGLSSPKTATTQDSVTLGTGETVLLATETTTNTAGTVGFDERLADVVAYIVKVGGLKLSAATTLPEGDADAVATSVTAVYDAGSLMVGVGHEVHGSSLTLGGVEEAVRVALSYKGAATKVNLFYQQAANLTGNINYDPTVMGLGFAQAMGDMTFKAQIHVASDLTDAASDKDTGATQTALGVDYKLSKLTTAYFIYADIANAKNTDGFNLGGGGYSGSAPDIAAKGDAATAMSLGLIHKF